MRTRQLRASGFTIIDALVAVAITALLLAILLPAIRAGRERLRCCVCLSSLHQLSNAFAAYVGENSAYPIWGLRGSQYFCNFAWGGKTNELAWKDYAGGVFFITARERPLNRMFLARRPNEVDPLTHDASARSCRFSGVRLTTGRGRPGRARRGRRRTAT